MTYDTRITAARGDIAAEELRGKIDAARYVTGTKLTVSVPVLDLVAAPNSTSLSSQLLMGETFIVYDEDVDTGLAWGQSLRDQYVGYVARSGLLSDVPAPNRYVSSLATHIYAEPNLKSRPLDRLPLMSALVTGSEIKGYVELETGGYCPAPHLRRTQVATDDFVMTGERFIGVPYLWGGRSSFGLDCSALAQTSLYAAGLSFPRDSDMQQSLGQGVVGTLQRGDLIFWKGHVGLMTDPENLLHANAFHMAVVTEPLAIAVARTYDSGGGEIVARRRL